MTCAVTTDTAYRVIKRGTTKTINLAITDGDGTPIDITGATEFKTTWKVDLSDTVPVLVLDATIEDGPNGLGKLSFTPIITAAIDLGSYVYDIVITLANGERHSLHESTVTLKGTVS